MDIHQDPNSTDIKSRFLIFLDLETTGLQVQKHEIIEIGALKVNCKKPFNIVEELEVKVKPKSIEKADKKALKVVRYTSEEWIRASSLEEALAKLEEFGRNGVLVGYNVNFDWAILNRAYYSLGTTDPFYYHRLDVMPMAYCKLYGKHSLKRFSLGEVCKYLKVKRENEHRALSDAKTTYLLFKKLMEM